MLNNIKEVFRYILKQKLLSISIILFVFVFSLLLCLSTEGLLWQVNLEGHRPSLYTGDLTTFSIYVTDDDITETSKTLMDINKVIEKNAFTYRLSRSLSDLYQTTTYLFFGDFSLINNHEILSDNEVAVYSDSEFDSEQIEVLESSYRINRVNLDTIRTLISEDETHNPVLIIAATEVPEEWTNSLSADSLYDLATNLVILKNDEVRINLFETIANDSFFAAIPRDTGQSDEISFISTYIFPLISMIVLVFMLSLYIILFGMIEGRIKTLSIHYFYGATTTTLVLRFTLSFTLLFVPSYALLRLIDKEGILLYMNINWILLLYLLIIITYSIYAYIILKRGNLMSRIRGDS